MTREVKYIIENKRFKTTWDDYLIYWEFVVPILILAYGLELAVKGRAFQDYLIGSLLIMGSILVTRFALLRKKQLNEFEEIANGMTQEENFNAVLEGLRKMNVVEIDGDIHNRTISAKYKSTFLPPFFEWLTIVCLDKRILINARPTPTTIMFWMRRNAIVELKRLV